MTETGSDNFAFLHTCHAPPLPTPWPSSASLHDAHIVELLEEDLRHFDSLLGTPAIELLRAWRASDGIEMMHFREHVRVALPRVSQDTVEEKKGYSKQQECCTARRDLSIRFVLNPKEISASFPKQ